MISVIIPAFNEEKQIAVCLLSLVAQETKVPFEVIVVDNNSTDRTAAITKSFSGILEVTVIRESKQGRGAARDAGARAATGDVLLFTEADTRVPSNWIESLHRYLADGAVAAVTGPCRFETNYWWKELVDFLQPLYMRLYRQFFGYYWLSGFNCGIKKDAYSKAGGFNRELNTLDDVVIGRSMRRIGRVVFAPDVSVLVSGRRFEQGLLKAHWEYVVSFIEVFILKKQTSTFADIR